MKAIQFRNFGGPEVLDYLDLPDPVPAEGEVLVKIIASGVNPSDWKIREGRFQSRMPNTLPIIPGWEFSGIVIGRGYSARKFEIGEEVFSFCRRPWIQMGSYAELICLPETYLAGKPHSLTHEEAAGVPLAGMTAFQCLFQAADCSANDLVLILGASGGVGSFAIQLAKNTGAKVVAVASGRNEQYLRSLGADEFIDYSTGDVRSAFIEAFPDGADLVLDFVGGETFTQGLACVKPGGNIISIIVNDFPSNGNFQTSYVFVEPNSKQLSELARWADLGRLKVHISEIFSLENARLAQERISQLHTRGKIILKM
ncbi:alcohol dehydrogenase, catalytic domain, GroES-like family [Leptospira fainei serovar Hurstbridge str. BUT 6]|uniref:Alcohol dehydrogenase, catalytic domain, GroES-like family n=1 Tax=Leptospira fainei serovar Hurstbridge str. BUT 6 TaxID=1193011 RepID=S3W463_9LEPT|nr:NADP-dependent oxidoreductase [Leptospira fainei]EPG75067.1 alcohol dehydrogenase, catalytic domain, GroES-like family [Leptospira fainei serovar Hurstbridge str. BUT 6]